MSNSPQPSKRAPQQATEPRAPVDLGDPEAVATRNKTLKGREARVENGMKLVLGHPDSRLWLYDLIEQMKPLQEPFTGNSGTFYNCGQQSIGKRLLSQLLDKHLEQYVTMCQEAKNVQA